MAERARDWPHAMIATRDARHQARRGRARRGCSRLSEMPEDWARAVDDFLALTEPLLAALEEVQRARRQRPLHAPADDPRRVAERAPRRRPRRRRDRGLPHSASRNMSARRCARPSATRAGSMSTRPMRTATLGARPRASSPRLGASSRASGRSRRRLAYAGMITGLSPDRPQMHAARACRTSIRARSSGIFARRSRQPPAGRLRAQAARSIRAATTRPASARVAGRPHQAAGAGAAAARPGGRCRALCRRRLRAPAAHGRAGAPRRRFPPCRQGRGPRSSPCLASRPAWSRTRQPAARARNLARYGASAHRKAAAATY